MVKEFEEAAFSLAIGEISQPIKTDYGYHIIQVLGHEDRELSADAFNTVKQQEFQTWLDAKKTEVGIKKFDIWATRVPVSPSIPQELLMQ
jgi:parvulin-like peptidyl-prolyl isomerase